MPCETMQNHGRCPASSRGLGEHRESQKALQKGRKCVDAETFRAILQVFKVGATGQTERTRWQKTVVITAHVGRDDDSQRVKKSAGRLLVKPPLAYGRGRINIFMTTGFLTTYHKYF